MDPDLLSKFLSALDEPQRSTTAQQLGEALRRRLEEARSVWPDVELAEEPFVRFVARHLPPGPGVHRELEALHTSDMYLVAACLAGSPRAVETLETNFLTARSPALQRLRLSADVVDEARQVCRYRLLVAAGGAEPKLADYSGAGTLRGWVRASIIRAAMRVERRPLGHVDTDPASLNAAASVGGDLELDYLKKLYGSAAREALEETFSALPVRERNLLRQYFGLNVGIDELASEYNVHRSTAARWVTRARDALVTKTRAEIVRRLALDDDEASSILRLLESQLRDAMGRLVAAEAPSA